MLGFVKLPRKTLSRVAGSAFLTLALGLGAATPALSIDARRPDSGLIPVREVVQAPPGAQRLCSVYDWACARSGKAMRIGENAMLLIKEINLRANRTIRPISDMSQYRLAERWALPTARGGDCEDYALHKKMELVKAGFPPEQLLVAAVLDRKRQSHAVLVVRTGTQDLVLDNLTNKVVPWDKTGYTFLRLQDPRNPARWVSVYAGGIFPLS